MPTGHTTAKRQDGLSVCPIQGCKHKCLPLDMFKHKWNNHREYMLEIQKKATATRTAKRLEEQEQQETRTENPAPEPITDALDALELHTETQNHIKDLTRQVEPLTEQVGFLTRSNQYLSGKNAGLELALDKTVKAQYTDKGE